MVHEWAKEERNVVLLPDRGPVGSLGRRLFEEWERVRKGGEKGVDGGWGCGCVWG